MDPHSENYFSWTPYNYVANNPLLLIDPNGMDWYQDEKGNTTWKKGSEAIEGYKNIGANYSYRQGDLTLSFKQNEMITLEEHVLDPGDWKTSQTTNADGTKKQCFDATSEMTASSGAETLKGGKDYGIVTGNETNTSTTHEVNSTGNTGDAIAYINSQIDNGKSVAVGVDYRAGNGGGNNDNITDHWVGISSRVTDLKTSSTSFRFYDPGTSRKIMGTSASNVLKLNSGGLLTGTTAYKTQQNTYTVSQVRKNR